jgi:hypothetical protein
MNAQNKKILFNFNEIPQTLMVNPGAEVDFQWHFGIPALSGLYAHAGISKFSVNDLFANDGINLNTKLENLLTKLDNKDFYTANQQTEIFNIGFRLNNQKNDYLSFGFYEEFDAILYHPKDVVTLAYEGNADFSKQIDFNDLSLKAELLGVYHIGLTRKISNKLTIGTRFKIYSSVFNVNSTNNYGYYFTRNGEDNIYHHQMQNADVTLKTSGIVHNKEAVIDQKIVNRFLASGNMGLGLDFGLTYHINSKWKTTASFTDLGFIRHTKNTTVYRIQGTRDFDGFNLEFPANNPIDYLSNFNEDFPTSEQSEKFTTLRSLKLNGALIYSFGQIDNNSCLRTTYEIKRRNELGLELYSILRPKKPQASATLFYYKRLAKFFRAKFTYTVDSYSAKNIGVGFSSHIGMFNLYGSADNLLGFTDLSKSNNQTINFGINFTLDKDTNKP